MDDELKKLNERLEAIEKSLEQIRKDAGFSCKFCESIVSLLVFSAILAATLFLQYLFEAIIK